MFINNSIKMKKYLYIVCIIAMLVLCWSVAYYFITKANIDKKNFKIQNEEYIQQKSEACLNEFRQYYDNNNYNNSSFNDYGYISDYWYSDIKYSPVTNSCIQYFEIHTVYSEKDFYHKYKIADETNRIGLYFCWTTYDSDDTLENCVEGYNKKLKELWLK